MFILSCSDSADEHRAIFEMLSGAVEEHALIRFQFNLTPTDKSAYDGQQLFAQVTCYPSNDGDAIRDTIVRLSSSLEGHLHVPDGTAAVSIELSSKDTFLKHYKSNLYIVLGKDREPVRKALTFLIWKQLSQNQGVDDDQTRENVAWHFSSERERYPDDISVYFCRWLYESQTGVLDEATIREDLAELAPYRGSALGDAMLGLGPFFIAETTGQIQASSNNGAASADPAANTNTPQTISKVPLPDAITGAPNNPIFNEPWFVNWLLKMRGPPYLVAPEWTNEKEQIIRANPLSLYTKRVLLGGAYKDIAPETSLYAIDALIAQTRHPLYTYYKMIVLSQFYPQRRAECMDLVNELKAVNEKDTYYAESLDPWHYYQGYRLEPYLVEANLLARSGSYNAALSTLRDARELLTDPWDKRHGKLLAQCSEYLLKQGHVDSSTMYMAAAAMYDQDRKYMRDTLHARHHRAATKLKYLAWQRELYKSLPDETLAPLPASVGSMQLSDGSTLDFRQLGDTVVVLECWVPYGPCTKNIRDTYVYLQQHPSEKVKAVVVTPKPRDLTESMKSLSIDLPVVKDGKRMLQKLGINAYPTTIFIRRGLVLAKYSGPSNIASIIQYRVE